jgi:hypothetical protein
MKALASRIERELAGGTWRHYAIYEEELRGIGPINEKDREKKIAQFATEHGFRLRFYKQGLCAIFEKNRRSSS